MTLHVVIGIEGEYSEKNEYVAGVFTDIEVARNLIEWKTAAGRQRSEERRVWFAKRQALSDKLKAQKLESVDEKTMAYFGREWLPSKYTMPSREEQEEMDSLVGPYPPEIEYDVFYVVSVPVLDQWGRWEDDTLSS